MLDKIVSFAVITTILFTGCKPYDSDNVNNQMLQGKWMKIDEYQYTDSTLKHSVLIDTTILILRNDSLFEHFVNSKESTALKFRISNYKLLIFRNDSLVNWLYIDSLSTDSMTLSITDMKWRYKKIE